MAFQLKQTLSKKVLLLLGFIVFFGGFLYFFWFFSFPVRQNCDFKVFSHFNWFCFVDESRIFDWKKGNIETFKKSVLEANNNKTAPFFRTYRYIFSDEPQFQYKQADSKNIEHILASFNLTKHSSTQFLVYLHITGQYKDVPPTDATLSRIVSNLFVLALSESYNTGKEFYDPASNYEETDALIRYFYEITEPELPIIVQ